MRSITELSHKIYFLKMFFWRGLSHERYYTCEEYALDQSADGRRVIDMRLIFEEFDPEELKRLKYEVNFQHFKV